MPEAKVMIRNKAGIHCRPSSVILTEKMKFPGVSFEIETPNGNITLESILELLALGLKRGDEILIRTSGDKADEALSVMCGLFAKEFDFPPKQ